MKDFEDIGGVLMELCNETDTYMGNVDLEQLENIVRNGEGWVDMDGEQFRIVRSDWLKKACGFTLIPEEV